MPFSYINSKPGVWTVGNQDDSGWVPESIHYSLESAIVRVHYLNGDPYPLKPETTAPYAPTRFDRLLESAFQGILSNPAASNLSESEFPEWR